MFPLDFIMYECMELAFNQEYQLLYVPSMLVELIVELLYHDPSKNVAIT